MLPNGFGVCESVGPPGCALGGGDDTGSFCGYHSNDPEGDLLYAVIPYNAARRPLPVRQPAPERAAPPTRRSRRSATSTTRRSPTRPATRLDRLQLQRERRPLHRHDRAPTADARRQRRLPLEPGDRRRPLLAPGGVVKRGRRLRAVGPPDAASFRSPKRIRTGQSIRFTARAHTGRARVKAYNWFFGAPRPGPRARRHAHVLAARVLPARAARHRQLGQLGLRRPHGDGDGSGTQTSRSGRRTPLAAAQAQPAGQPAPQRRPTGPRRAPTKLGWAIFR